MVDYSDDIGALVAGRNIEHAQSRVSSGKLKQHTAVEEVSALSQLKHEYNVVRSALRQRGMG